MLQLNSLFGVFELYHSVFKELSLVQFYFILFKIQYILQLAEENTPYFSILKMEIPDEHITLRKILWIFPTLQIYHIFLHNKKYWSLKKICLVGIYSLNLLKLQNLFTTPGLKWLYYLTTIFGLMSNTTMH